MAVSKMIVYRQTSSRKVCAAATAHRASAEKGVTDILGADLGAMAGNIMSASADKLKEVEQKMVLADTAHNAELSDDIAGRDFRDAQVELLRAVLIDFREFTNTIYGPTYLRQLGIEGPTPSEGPMLRNLSLQVCEGIDTVPRPAPRFEGMNFDGPMWKEKITAPTNGLIEALEKIALEEREAEQTIKAKRESIAEYDKVFSKVANLVSAMLNIAGEEELAAKVRPSKSRPGTTVDNSSDIEIDTTNNTDSDTTSNTDSDTTNQ